MDLYSGHINKLITELASLPGIGEKSAARLAFHLINMPVPASAAFFSENKSPEEEPFLPEESGSH